MSPTRNVASKTSNFEDLFVVALSKYTKCTGKDLRNHPLAYMIDGCVSPDSIVAIFQEQSRAFDEFRNGDPKLIKWLAPVVNGLYAISTSVVISAAACLTSFPANIIFSGISVLLSTAKYVRDSYDALVDIFECIENFSSRLQIYTQIKPTLAMTEMVIKIMAELLGVLALATKQINQGRLKKYARKLLGEQDIESVLQRIDRLTFEESKMTVAQTLDLVNGLVLHMEEIMKDGKVSKNDMREVLIVMHEITMKVEKMERDQLQEKFRRWLYPPDPWSNHNIAREAHHPGTAMWFIQGETFRRWKMTGSFLWVNGIPGSGKTIISSSIAEDVRDVCRTGLATFAIFYCDFRNPAKQNVRMILSSILIQLSRQSHTFSQVLSSIYVTHGDGSQQPSIDELLGCLKTMLALQGQGSVYLVVDALDECPNSSGCPTLREQVLAVVRELIKMQLPHVHFCITSLPEIDIRDALGPLATHCVPIHDQAGQKQDIVNYINDFVVSDSWMQHWGEEEKQLVIQTLNRKARGMFRWVNCQFETLRQCFPPSIRCTLDELPKTLDDSYERILREIDEKKRPYAYRLFQCLVISIRPLCVKELSELSAILPDAGSTLGFENGWRPENPEEFILSACSTLVTIVKNNRNNDASVEDDNNDDDNDGDDDDDDDNGNDDDNAGDDSNDDEDRVVQFSHVSVREYLTSARIANNAHVSHFHIPPKPAHALLARACLNVLLQLDYSLDEAKTRFLPLARYAAKHWVDHARFEDVSSDIQDMMDCLFDSNKPHLGTWLWLCDVEKIRSRYRRPPNPTRPDAVPLYYAVLCGFRDLSGRLLDARPQDVNAWGGHYYTPLLAALNKEHTNIALLLLERGADVESRGRHLQTALYVASSRGYTEVVSLLINRGANPNAQCDDKDVDVVKWTPLFVALREGRLEIARMLLMHGADVNYQDNFGRGPLHIASRHPSDDLARLLLDHNVDPDASDYWGRTALHEASSKGHIAVITLLLERGAKVDARSKSGSTPLDEAKKGGQSEVLKLLLDHGADPDAQMNDHQTAS